MDLARPAGRGADIYADERRRRTTIRRHQSVADAVYRTDGARAARLMEQQLPDILAWADGPTRSPPLHPVEPYLHP